MPDIITSQVFSDGEKGITATKMNNIIANAVIDPSFVTAKPSSSTLDPTDQLLEVKGAGTYARITGSQLISSVSAQVDATPQIYSVRLRSFNAVGNPTFEVDQRNVGTGATFGSGTWGLDRWAALKNAMSSGAATAVQTLGAVALPGTNYYITTYFLRVTLTAQQASLAASDILWINQSIEGPILRELRGDVHSLSLLVRSSVANLKFGVALRDPGSATRSLLKLAALGAANTFTLISLPNLPVWDAGGGWFLTPGNVGYQLGITLAAGSTFTAPANDTWQTGNFVGAVGQDNFASKPVNSTFDIAFVQHEPGAVCTTPMDCPYSGNLQACKRYYAKSVQYNVLPQANYWRQIGQFQSGSTGRMSVNYEVELAKVPTVTLYDITPTINRIWIDAVGSAAINTTIANSDTRGFGTVTTTAAQGAGANFQPLIGSWLADTGW